MHFSLPKCMYALTYNPNTPTNWPLFIVILCDANEISNFLRGISPSPTPKRTGRGFIHGDINVPLPMVQRKIRREIIIYIWRAKSVIQAVRVINLKPFPQTFQVLEVCPVDCWSSENHSSSKTLNKTLSCHLPLYQLCFRLRPSSTKPLFRWSEQLGSKIGT